MQPVQQSRSAHPIAYLSRAASQVCHHRIRATHPSFLRGLTKSPLASAYHSPARPADTLTRLWSWYVHTEPFSYSSTFEALIKHLSRQPTKNDNSSPGLARRGAPSCRHSCLIDLTASSLFTDDDAASVRTCTSTTLATRTRTGGTGTASSLPGSLHPQKGAFQLLGRSAQGDKAAANFNGKMTTSAVHRPARPIGYLSRAASLVRQHQILVSHPSSTQEALIELSLTSAIQRPTRPIGHAHRSRGHYNLSVCSRYVNTGSL